MHGHIAYLLLVSTLLSSIWEHVGAQVHHQTYPSPADAMRTFAHGNDELVGTPGFKNLSGGQSPSFAILTCSDSRISEGNIFGVEPGTIFSHRNIANRYDGTNVAITSFLAYAVTALSVQHIVVMGHYGCGGVNASMDSRKTNVPKNDVVQEWIEPIRQEYEKVTGRRIPDDEPGPNPPRGYHDQGLKDLVERNVINTALAISKDSSIVNHWDKYKKSHTSRSITPEERQKLPVFIHSWVYDIETGNVVDLNRSIGSGLPGEKIPMLQDFKTKVLPPSSAKASEDYILKRVLSPIQL